MLSTIKRKRMEQGLRQMDVARRVHLSESQLSKIETGRVDPSHEDLAKIAAALGVAPEELRGD